MEKANYSKDKNTDKFEMMMLNLGDKMGMLADSNTESNKRYNALSDTVQSMSIKLNDVTEAISNIDTRMTNIEKNEEITTEQDKEIKRIVYSRACEILESTDINETDYNSYRPYVIRKIYWDCKRYTGMANAIERTPKKYYDHIVDYVEGYHMSSNDLAEAILSGDKRKQKENDKINAQVKAVLEDYFSNKID